MAKYVLVYKGGASMGGTEAEQQAEFAKWGVWYGGLGDAVVDGGAPFGPAKSISANGSVADGGAGGLTGYTIVSADDLDAAVAKAQGCPVLAGGGAIEVYEAIQMM